MSSLLPRLGAAVCCAAALLAQQAATHPPVPDWAWPGSPGHKQVPPPADFHRQSATSSTPIGIFDGQSDIGSAVVPGSATYDAAARAYTIHSAGYNIWYTRDEFRFLWKKMSGDVSLAADVNFPDPNGYNDRKAVLMIRQSLDDDSKAMMAALHGTGMFHLAWRPEPDVDVIALDIRVSAMGLPGRKTPSGLISPKRLGIEKRGDAFAIFVSLDGEPMHQFGPPQTLRLEGPFYAGIGFCSHVPDKVDTAVLSNVVLENRAGKVR